MKKRQKYQIYQLDTENENVLKDHKLFESWEMLNRTAGFNFQDYKKVYDGVITAQTTDVATLEEIFEIFNIRHPEDFHGHSLSVSDVVVLDNAMYYCDSIGWQKI